MSYLEYTKSKPMSETKTILIVLKSGKSYAVFHEPQLQFDPVLREPVLTSAYNEKYFLVRFADVEAVFEPLPSEAPAQPTK